MKEISLHILDIVQNSIRAKAELIKVSLDISEPNDTITIKITDNGSGMDSVMLENVSNPFSTTRTTRSIGMGLPLLKAGVEATGGSFCIDSQLGEGTHVYAQYAVSHIDRPPIGDFASTMHMLIVTNPSTDFIVNVGYDGERQTLDTREIRQVLGDEVSLDMPDVSDWIKSNLHDIFKSEYSEL